MVNLILNTDSYKTSHYLQYPPGTEYISSYIESRGGDFDQHLFFGLQIYLKEYLSKPISKKNIEEAEEFLNLHGLPFYREGWSYILQQYGGHLPLVIEAVPEGMVLPTKNVLVQVCNTDPKCFWLPQYIETSLLRAIWYPVTVATISWQCKQVIKRYLEETADNTDSLTYKLHDFGARGATSFEAASIGGAAHLVNFKGSDTIAGILAVRKYYGENMAGVSIPAAEHSTVTSWGKDNEQQAYQNIIKVFSGPGKLLSIVSDSYDLWHTIDNIFGGELKQQIIEQQGKIVIRPDSGDPMQVICTVIERLMGIFGHTVNSKGYKVLPPFIGVIHGDSISLPMIDKVLAAMKQEQLSADNIVFGMGGELLQKMNRDTLKFAMKVSSIKKDGTWYDVFKQPILDEWKVSKNGILALIKDEQGRFRTIKRSQVANGQKNNLVKVFENGKILKEYSFAQIRDNAA